MSQAVAVPRTPALSDVIELVKPRIMIMALLTAAGGISLAPGLPPVATTVALLVATGLLVGSANTLNMYLERDIDCLMSRTKNRPLPGQRMEPAFALWFGVAQAFVAVPLLTFALNPLTAMLGVVALLAYVNLYTPLKQHTTLATWIGAVPGAMPALMGWTAVTGSIDAGGLAVFGLLFIWQIPHFHAIALFRTKEYARAGLVTLPGTQGKAAAHRAIVLYSVVQVAISVTPYLLGVAGMAYLVTAGVCGAAYLGYAFLGLRATTGPRWAKRLFIASVVYLPIIFTVLVVNGQH
jgi:protoheme IX farnesyltransferase